jgi:16S rRNA (uracil1498-N3)-methyltransferase
MRINNIPKELFAENNYFAYEKIAGKTQDLFTCLTTKTGSISILVGAEGGFSPKEATLVTDKYNFTPVSLGKRILRSETAPLFLMSIISYMYECGDGSEEV